MNYPSNHEKLNKLSEYLYSKYGLEYRNKKENDLSTAVLNVAENLELNEDEVFEKLFLEGQNEKLIGLLLDSLKISETYFFREEPILKKICNEVLNRSYLDRTRVWCAGCSSGEEPYSLLMMLSDNNYTLSKSSLELNASDINRNLLEKAKNGLYTTWSFRNTSPKTKARYFSGSNDLYKLDSRIVNHVNFSVISLTDDLKIIQSEKNNYYDIILCRNVLIYHSDKMREKILDNFFYMLKEGGLLFTGLTEIPFVKKNRFQKILEKEIIYFKKPLPDKKNNSQRDISKVAERYSVKNTTEEANKIYDSSTLEIAKRFYQSGDYQKCTDTIKQRLDKKSSPQMSEEQIRKATILLINSYINIGKNETAINECRNYLNTNKNEHNFYLMLANLYVHSDDNDSAIDNLTKAIYLKPDYIPAHFLLARIYMNCGNKVMSKKHYEICIKLLNQLDADLIIDDTDGFSAGSLLQVINNIQKNL